MIARDVLLYYPDPNKPFDIEGDASDYQLGVRIFQEGNLVANYSRKLTPAQRKYPVCDKEALSFLEALHEYRSILYGAQIRLWTDHKNLAQRDINSPRLLRWRLLIEEFNPDIRFWSSDKNFGADAVSRLALREEAEMSAVPDYFETRQPQDLIDQLFELMLFYPEYVDLFPLTFDKIAAAQNADPVLLALANQGIYRREQLIQRFPV